MKVTTAIKSYNNKYNIKKRREVKLVLWHVNGMKTTIIAIKI